MIPNPIRFMLRGLEIIQVCFILSFLRCFDNFDPESALSEIETINGFAQNLELPYYNNTTNKAPTLLK